MILSRRLLVIDKIIGSGTVLHMSTPTDSHGAETKKATVNGLAAVGFIALLLGGVFLAIYAASYVPQTLSRLTGAVFLSGEKPTTATTTEETVQQPETPVTTPKPTTPVVPATPVTPTTPNTPVTGGPQVTPSQPRVVYTQPKLYGLPDLALVNTQSGYMSGSTFVEADEVPRNRDAAVRFIIQNLGTNVVSNWGVRVKITGEDTATGIGGLLYPNGTQVFTLRITDPKKGETLRISIDIDYQDRIAESNENNNDETLRLDVRD